MDSIVSHDRYHLHRRHQEPHIDLFLEKGTSMGERAAGDMNWSIWRGLCDKGELTLGKSWLGDNIPIIIQIEKAKFPIYFRRASTS